MSRKAYATVALLALALSGCSSSTQTGGGGNSGAAASQAATQAATPTAAAARPLTVDDVIAQGWLAGNAEPQLGLGTQGKTDVVASGPIAPSPGGTTVMVAVRNSTSAPVTHLDVTAAAKDSSGKLIASGRSQGFNPQTVPAGGFALGYVFFAPGTPLAADSKLTFTVVSQSVNGTPYDQDLKVDEASASGTNIVGQATNSSKETLNSPYSVKVYCWDEKGAPLSVQQTFADPSAKLAAGQSVTFQAQLFDHPCPSFLVGVSGYKSLS